jgi:hypothetical protein
MTEKRDEKAVLESLSENEKKLLKRVLQIERSQLHLRASNPTDDILTAVKEIIP